MNVNAMCKVTIIFFLFVLICPTYAQTPGGIPDEDLKLWLIPEEADIIKDGSGNVSSWQDQINGELFIQTNVASQPTLQTNAINNNPAILFDGTDDALGSTFNFDASSAMSVIRVVKPNDADGVLFYQGSTNNLFDRSPVVFQNGSFEYVPQSSNSSLGLVDETAYDGLPKILSLVRFGPRNSFIFRDGKLELNERLGSPPIDMTFDTTVIGVNPSRLIERPSDPLYFDGIVSEIIILESSISLPLQQRLDSYLAIKYGITLDNTDNADHVVEGNYINAVDEVVWDVTQNLIYHHNVIGIAKDVASSLDQSKSSNSALSDPRLTIAHDDMNAPLSLNDGQYFIVGDDNEAFEEVAFEIEDTIDTRIGTIWKVQNTGSVTNVSMAIDISGVTLVKGTSDLQDFNLIINENGDQVFEEDKYRVYTADSLVSDVLYFSELSINDGETFSITTFVNNLPVAINDTLKLTEDDIIADDKSIITINSVTRLIENDRDPEGIDTSIVAVNRSNVTTTAGTFGSLTWTANGTYSYELFNIDLDTLEWNELVVDSFEYVISDQNLTDTAFFFIEIQGVNDKPVVFDDDIDIYEDSVSYSSIIKNENLKTNDFDAESIDSSYIYKFSFDGVEEDDDDNDVTGLYGRLDWDSTGTFIYTLNPLNPNGLDTLQEGEAITETFTYILDDGDGLKDTADFVVWVHGQNDAPVAENDTVKITEDVEEIDDVTEGLNLLTNDSDIDGDDLVIQDIVATKTLTHIGAYGELTLTTSGGFLYDVDTLIANTLEEGEVVYDVFEYVVFDQVDSTDTVSFVVEITGINDKPLAYNDTLTLLEDDITFETNLTTEEDSLFVNDIDYESLDSSFVSKVIFDGTTIVNTMNAGLTNEIDGLYGSLLWDSTGNISYERNIELDSLFEGEIVADTFSYVLDDGDGAADTASLIMEIVGENDAPVAISDTVEITEDIEEIDDVTEGLNLLTNDSDIDGDDLVILDIVVTKTRTHLGMYGELTLDEDGGFLYDVDTLITNTLEEGEIVYDVFEYVIFDQVDSTDTVSFVVEITGINDKPLAYNDTLTLLEDDITFETNLTTEEDSLLVNDIDYESLDSSFVSKVIFDGTTIVNTMNAGLTNEIDGLYGSLLWDSTGNISYERNIELDSLFEGEIVADTFSYVLDDGDGAADTASLIMEIVGENDAPIAEDDSLQIIQSNIQIISTDTDSLLANDVDPDGDNLSIISVNGENLTTSPATITGLYGSLELNLADGSYTYINNQTASTPIPMDSIVVDSFTYTIEDDLGATATALFKVKITGENDAPEAFNDNIIIDDSTTIGQDINLSNSVLENDTDIDLNDVITVNQVRLGSTTITDETQDLVGKFGKLNWDEDGNFIYILTDVNIDTLVPGESVIDSFYYQITDDSNTPLTAEAVFRVVIEGTNYAPVAVNDTANISEGDNQIEAGITADVDSMLVNDTFGNDPEEQSINIISINNQANTTIVGLYGDLTWESNGHYLYTIDSARASVIPYDVIENDIFEYVIEDDYNDTDTAKLVIRVLGINSPPNPSNDSLSLTRSYESDTTFNLLSNDTDDGNDMMITSINGETDFSSTLQGDYGNMTWDAQGNVSYTLVSSTVSRLLRGQSVTDSFLYVVEDNFMLQDSAYLYVIINGEDYEVSTSQGFTPNDDGKNDVFQIQGYSYVEGEFSELNVFSSKGTLVYKSSPYENNWDATSNQGGVDKVDPGIYFFILETETTSPIKGYVFINY